MPQINSVFNEQINEYRRATELRSCIPWEVWLDACVNLSGIYVSEFSKVDAVTNGVLEEIDEQRI